MENESIKVYFKALSEIFGSTGMAEKWLDNNSHKLSGKTARGNKIRKREAKREIYSLLSKQT